MNQADHRTDHEAAQPPEPRESIWSIRRKHTDTFFTTLFTLWLTAAVIITLIYVNDHQKPETMTNTQWVMRSIVAILPELGGITIALVLVSMILNRRLRIAGAVIVLTYEKLKEMMVLSQRRKFRAEGQVLGEALGEARAHKAWTEWLERKQAAERNQLPFDESPPNSSNGAHPR